MTIISKILDILSMVVSQLFSKVIAPLLSHLFSPKKNGGDIDKVPGPEGLPLLGNALPLLSTNFHRTLIKWADQFGGVYKINALGDISLVVSDLEALDSLLATPPIGVPKNLILYKAMSNLTSPVSEGNLITYGNFDQWKSARTTLDPAFKPDTLSSKFPAIKKELVGVVGQLAKMAEESAGADLRSGRQGLLVDIGDVCVRAALNMTATLAYDSALGLTENLRNESPIIKALGRARIEETNRAKSPIGKIKGMIPFLESNRQHKADLELIHNLFGTLGDHVRAQKCPAMAMGAKETSIVCALQKLKDYRTGQPMGKNEANSNVGVLSLAGSFPAALIMTYAFYEIAAHPAVQNKIEAELADAGLLGKPENITFESMAKLKFLDAAVKESTRIHPIVPQVQRLVDREIVLKGYKIPKDTPIFIGIGAVHHSKANYTEPNKYWPERWEYTEEQVKEEFGKDGSTATPIGNINNIKGSFIPFSAGNRNCLGRYVAWLQATSTVAHLISAFRLSVDSTTSNPEGIVKEESFAITINPGKPIKLRLSPRK